MHGSTVGPSLFRMTEEQDVVVQGADLPKQFDYVALGHIHKPQWLTAQHLRYSGSIERMDLGEHADEKSLTIVEIGPEGRQGDPTILPLKTTAIYEVTIVNPAIDLPRLRQEYPNAREDLVNLNIRYTAGRDHLEEVLFDLEKIFPRWYARDWKESGALGPPLAMSGGGGLGFAKTVREYLGQELVQHDTAERDAILKIADDLLKEME
jgi:exonuclease SbcD